MYVVMCAYGVSNV